MTTTAVPERAATATTATDRITIALGEYDIGWHNPAASIAWASFASARVRASSAAR